MKKAAVLILPALLLAAGFGGAGGAAQETRPGIVRVAVNVADGGRAVEGLKMADFEVLENGSPRPVRAFYDVDRDAVIRQEGEAGFGTFVGRRFTLMFQLFEYHAKLADSIREIVEKEMRPADSLEIQTPMRNYQLTPQALAGQPRRAIAEKLIEIVRKDISTGNQSYNSLLGDLKKIVRSISGVNPMETLETDAETEDFSVELLLPRYRGVVQNLDALRKIDTEKIIEFARAVKKQRGRKYVFFFYQREFRPELDPQVLSNLFAQNQDKSNILGDLQELFQTYRQNFTQDIPRMVDAFADSGAGFNLIFLNRAPERVSRVVMREQSEDVFRALSDVASATGGVVNTSQNPLSGIRTVLKGAERYYLLDYEAGAPNPAGVLNTIRIRIKGKDYKVTHRAGYLN
jgi:hypothetical protein